MVCGDGAASAGRGSPGSGRARGPVERCGRLARAAGGSQRKGGAAAGLLGRLEAAASVYGHTTLNAPDLV